MLSFGWSGFSHLSKVLIDYSLSVTSADPAVKEVIIERVIEPQGGWQYSGVATCFFILTLVGWTWVVWKLARVIGSSAAAVTVNVHAACPQILSRTAQGVSDVGTSLRDSWDTLKTFVPVRPRVWKWEKWVSGKSQFRLSDTGS